MISSIKLCIGFLQNVTKYLLLIFASSENPLITLPVRDGEIVINYDINILTKFGELHHVGPRRTLWGISNNPSDSILAKHSDSTYQIAVTDHPLPYLHSRVKLIFHDYTIFPRPLPALHYTSGFTWNHIISCPKLWIRIVSLYCLF